MTTIRAKRAGRIDVWPTWDDAVAADTEVSKVIRNMTIWPTMRQARDNVEFEGDDSDGGPEIPAWAAALRNLVFDPSDFLFAYNFASGGSGEGWNNVTEELLTVDAWTSPGWNTWYPNLITDGLGLAPGNNDGVLVDGILPDVASGGTILLECRAYTPTSINTSSRAFAHLVDLPDDNHEGGLDLFRDEGAVDATQLVISNGIGAGTSADSVVGSVQVVRGVCNYPTDAADIVGSINGRPTGSRSGFLIEDVTPNNITIHNNKGTSDADVYITIVAVFALQPDGDLPSMSALS